MAQGKGSASNQTVVIPCSWPALVLRDLRDFSRPQFLNLQDGIIDPTFDEIMWVEHLTQCLALRRYLVIAPNTYQMAKNKSDYNIKFW